MSPLPPISQHIEIDTRLESYANFLDFDKIRQLDDLTAGTKLEHAVFALGTNWKSATNAMRLPWLMVESNEHFGRGFGRDRNFAGKCISAISNRLANACPFIKKIERIKLMEAVAEIGEGVKKAEIEAENQIDKKQFWETYIDPTGKAGREFRLSIWGSQRTGYSAIYHAYENFIRECIGVAEGNPEYRIERIKLLCRDTLKHIDQEVIDICIDNRDIEAVRQVRNALAHNGGRSGPQLLSGHGVSIVQDVLQIQPDDNRRLLRLLQDRAYFFAQKCVVRAIFQ